MEEIVKFFIVEYEKSLRQINFVELLNSFYGEIKKSLVRRPTTCIDITENNEKLVSELQIRIFQNFNNNPYFEQEMAMMIDKKIYLEPLYLLVQECQNKEIFAPKNVQNLNNILARLILILHFSKCNFESRYFRMFLVYFKSIKVVENLESSFGFNLREFCEKLLSNKNLKNILNKTIKIITNKECGYDCAKTEIIFFTANEYFCVNGYAGNNAIYLCYTSMCNFFYIKTNQNIILFKLNLLRLIQHEVSHVALLNEFCNLNLSTPEFKETIYLNNPMGKIHEAGVIGESLLLNGRIDLSCADLNISYCEKFLETFLEGTYSEFDPLKANAKIVEKPIYHMAIDFEPEDEIEFM